MSNFLCFVVDVVFAVFWTLLLVTYPVYQFLVLFVLYVVDKQL